MKTKNDGAVNLLQEFDGCRFVYDLSAHKVEVFGPDERLLFMAQPLPDNPGGFDLANEGTSIAVHNPAGVDFVGAWDMYDDAQAAEGK